MTSIYAPFAKALRARAVFPPPSSSREQQAAWKQGYDDGQRGVKHALTKQAPISITLTTPAMTMADAMDHQRRIGAST
jgi:hypothetical protein